MIGRTSPSYSLGDGFANAVLPMRKRAHNSLGADGVGAVHVDNADLEPVPMKGGLLQEGHHRHDAVIPAEVVVESEPVDEDVPVLMEELNSFTARAGEPRRLGQRPEVVNGENDRSGFRRGLLHSTIMPGRRRPGRPHPAARAPRRPHHNRNPVGRRRRPHPPPGRHRRDGTRPAPPSRSALPGDTSAPITRWKTHARSPSRSSCGQARNWPHSSTTTTSESTPTPAAGVDRQRPATHPRQRRDSRRGGS